MGDIFHSAECVFVYLGHSLMGGNLFWEFLQSFISEGDFGSPRFEEQVDGFMERDSNELSMGLDDLIRRPWFHRAWTYQELRVAKSALAVCGGSFMPWHNFTKALSAFNGTGNFLPIFSPLRAFLREQSYIFKVISTPVINNPTVKQPQSQTSLQQELPKEPLLDLLVDGWPRDASDARDKIYAFMSRHLNSTPYGELEPDYTPDIPETFVRLIRIYINNERNLNFPRFARGIDQPVHNHEAGLPNPEPRWMPLVNLDRVPDGKATKIAANASTTQKILSKPSLNIDLASWACDLRVEGMRKKVSQPSFSFDDNLFNIRHNISPSLQSIHDFSKRLVIKGCALARVSCDDSEALKTENHRLGKFSTLPRCAMERAFSFSNHEESCGISPAINEFLRLQQFKNSKTPRSCNMVGLLLQTLLHDQSGCHCFSTRSRQDGKSVNSSQILKAYCPFDGYPRSMAKISDWLFILDGLFEPVILRPHLKQSDGDGARSEVGFDFVSVCPLATTNPDVAEDWANAPCAYGNIILF
ncbi:hypothetical protein F5884DRAFT_151139 [Xylogone sp. PMI_703]|nr:hypothetical protein F5884DRAFT_151139 [Xylogone sp. PMI_703]